MRDRRIEEGVSLTFARSLRRSARRGPRRVQVAPKTSSKYLGGSLQRGRIANVDSHGV